MASIRTLLRTGLIALGVLFGPEFIYAVIIAIPKMVRESKVDELLVAIPAMVALISCALWGFLVGHWYVRRWFMLLSVILNTWCAFDIMGRSESLLVRASGLIWILWSWRFFSLCMHQRSDEIAP